jgi:cytochrome P450
MSLAEKLTQDPVKRKQLIKDATKVLDAEVSGKSGISGLAVKGVFRVVKGFQPGFIPKAIDDLLDEFVTRIEPFYDSWVANPEGRDLRGHFVHHGSDVSDALLGVTDERAKHSKHKTLVKAYGKLRPRGKQHVQAAMPRVGEMIDRQTAEFR